MLTINFPISGPAGVDFIRLLVDADHAALAIVGVTQGFPRREFAGILRKIADAMEDPEAVMREARQQQLAAGVPPRVPATEMCPSGKHTKAVGAPCTICGPGPGLRTA